MCIIRRTLVLAATFMVLIMLADSNELTAPGASANGDLYLNGEAGTTLSFDTPPVNMIIPKYIEDTGTKIKDVDATMVVTTDGIYDLTVTDRNTGANKGYMLETTTSAPLHSVFNIYKGEVAYPLTSPALLEDNHGISNSETLTYKYSQQFINDDAPGTYAISLHYALTYAGV